MTEQEMMKNEDEIEINLGELFALLKAQYKLIIISTLVTTIVAGVMTVFFIDRKYQSVASIYPKPEVTEGMVDYTQINANNLMVNNYIEMLKGNNIQSQVAESLGMTTAEVSNSVTISNQTNTQIISISVTTTDPELKDIFIGMGFMTEDGVDLVAAVGTELDGLINPLPTTDDTSYLFTLGALATLLSQGEHSFTVTIVDQKGLSSEPATLYFTVTE